jgi:Helix-turn-helix domain
VLVPEGGGVSRRRDPLSLRFRWRTLVLGEDSTLGPWARLCAAALVEIDKDDDGICWPALSTLAWRMGGVSERTVRDAIRELETAGLLRVFHRAGVSSVYTFLLPTPARAAGVKDEPRHEPRQEVPPEQLEQLEQLRREPSLAPANVNVPTSGSPAQALVAGYVDLLKASGSPAPRRLVGQVAHQVGELVSEGVPAETIERALRIMLERRLNPSTLPSLIPEAAAGPARRRRSGREHVVDELFRQEFGVDARDLRLGADGRFHVSEEDS